MNFDRGTSLSTEAPTTSLINEEKDTSEAKLGHEERNFRRFDIDNFDIKLDNKKKNVIHYTIPAIISNFVVLLYVGPTPFSKMSDVESHEVSTLFYIWDLFVMAYSLVTIMMALSKRVILNEIDIHHFRVKMIVVSACQIVNGFLVIIEAGALKEVVFSLLLRIVTTMSNLMLWKVAEELERFYKENRPIFY